MYTTTYPSPLGQLTLACNETGLTGLWLEGQKYFALPAGAVSRSGLPAFVQARDWLDRYFAGARPDPGELPLSPAGTPFRQTVWGILREIPYGQTATYGEVARETAARLGRETMSSQAVGGAVGRNPLSILIPCHRVVGTNGNLTGYAGGVGKKAWLLAHEGVDVSRFTCPKAGT